MASVLNRTTKQYLVSVSTPDYPVGQWIADPDLTAVSGFNSRYWVITGDLVTLMSQAQRDAVDASLLAAQRDSVASSLDGAEGYERAAMLAIMDETNLHAARIKSILDAIDGAGTFAAMKTAIAGIQDPPQRTVANLKTALRARLGT